jgi:hypothetical protein
MLELAMHVVQGDDVTAEDFPGCERVCCCNWGAVDAEQILVAGVTVVLIIAVTVASALEVVWQHHL